MHPGDLARGFSDLEMTWLRYCAGAATEFTLGEVLSYHHQCVLFQTRDIYASIFCDPIRPDAIRPATHRHGRRSRGDRGTSPPPQNV